MTLQADVRNLAGLSAFRDLEPEALRLVAFSAVTRILRSGDVLFEQGETSECGFVVLSGSVTMENSSGDEAVVRAPALLGELALVIETLRPGTAIALEPTSVLEVSRTLYHRVLEEYPASAERVRALIAARLFEMRGELDDLRRSMAEN